MVLNIYDDAIQYSTEKILGLKSEGSFTFD